MGKTRNEGERQELTSAGRSVKLDLSWTFESFFVRLTHGLHSKKQEISKHLYSVRSTVISNTDTEYVLAIRPCLLPSLLAAPQITRAQLTIPY